MVLHHSCSAPGPWLERTGEIISFSAKILFSPSRWTPFMCWSGNNSRGFCCILRSHRLYSQPDCSLYYTLWCCHCPHVHMLPHSRSPTHTLCTHTSHTALFLKGATPLLQQWQLQTHWGNFFFFLSKSPLLQKGVYNSNVTYRNERTHRQNSNTLLFHWRCLFGVWSFFGFPACYIDNLCVINKKATVCKLCRNKIAGYFV